MIDPSKDKIPFENKELDNFKKNWKKYSTEQKVDTLLNMTMSIAYRLDILASVVSGIPAVEEMQKTVSDKIQKEQQDETK